MHFTRNQQGNKLAIIGLDRQMKLVDRIKDEDTNVFLVGETGTGKELISNALHYNSRRKDASILFINCATLDSLVMISQIFGYEKGAFTDARRHPGILETCKSGTLILNEVDKLKPDYQQKLLDAVGDGHYFRMGTTKQVPMHTRLVFATQNIGGMKPEFYYRLGIKIEIPPLREHMQDLAELTEFYMSKYAKKYGVAQRSLDMKPLRSHDWPGNVRELKNTLRDFAITGELKIDDMYAKPASSTAYTELLPDPLELLSNRNGQPLPTIPEIRDWRRKYEYALVHLFPNYKIAAQELGIGYRQVRQILDNKPDCAGIDEFVRQNMPKQNIGRPRKVL